MIKQMHGFAPLVAHTRGCGYLYVFIDVDTHLSRFAQQLAMHSSRPQIAID
jgi:hypothetical protein